MTRRTFLAASAMSAASLTAKTNVKLGIDLFSLRAEKWTAIQFLDYCAKQNVQVVHFSEIRFLGSLDPGHLKELRAHAAELGLEVEIGMKSICPISKMFEPSQGTAEEQLGRMIVAARIVGSKIVRAVLGGADDRKTGPLSDKIEATVKVLHNVRAQAQDHGIRIAIENHAGDMQARELKGLVEAAGPEFVGVCIDSGNPLWTLESPHVTLDVLHPYVLTSHLRDSAVWKTGQGAAVTWVVMGQGNVGIDSYVRRFVELCPGKPLSLESIVFGPRLLPYRDPAFWSAYQDVPAWDFEQFVELAGGGKPCRDEPWETADEAEREKKALEESLRYTKKLVGAA